MVCKIVPILHTMPLPSLYTNKVFYHKFHSLLSRKRDKGSNPEILSPRIAHSYFVRAARSENLVVHFFVCLLGLECSYWESVNDLASNVHNCRL